MKTKSFLALLLSTALTAQPAFAAATLPPALGQIAAAPAAARAAAGLAQFSAAPYAGPGPNADSLHGIFPGQPWRSGGQLWENISNGAGQAMWQRVDARPLPGDVIGVYASAVSLTSNGSGYSAGQVLTFQGGVTVTINTVSGGVPATWTITQPKMKSCAPSGAIGQVSTTGGTGSGATWTFTIKQPVLYSLIRATVCYTSNIMEVARSDTGATLNIGYTPDGVYDYKTALSFGAGLTPVPEYQNYTDGPTSNVAIWYDQGGGGYNATQGTVANQPPLYPGRTFGAMPAITFNSQGVSGGGLPYPTNADLVVPAFTVAGTDATIVHVGGDQYSTALPIYIVDGSYKLGISDGNTGGDCLNANSGATANLFTGTGTKMSDTPEIDICSFTGGYGTVDTSHKPPPTQVTTIAGTVAVGSTLAVTVSGGMLASAYTVTYTATSNDVAATSPRTSMVTNLAAMVNSDPTMAANGISVAINRTSANFLDVYDSIAGVTHTITVTAGGGISNGGSRAYENSAANGGSFSGGYIGYSGYMYSGFEAIVPWGLSIPEMRALKMSLAYYFNVTPQAGAIVFEMGASNMSGNLTPFRQDWPADLPRLLGRDDVQVFNWSVGGLTIGTFLTNPTYFETTLQQLKAVNPANNWVSVAGEYNSFNSGQTASQLYTTYQSLGALVHTYGYKMLCQGEGPKNVSSTDITNMAAFQALLAATPGNCDAVVDPRNAGAWNQNTVGPWSLPFFEQNDTGGHLSAAGNGAMAVFEASALAGLLQ
jgi:hypothetical protein